MKIKWKQVEIECTIDEFEDMVARGWFGLKSLQEAFDEEYPDLTVPKEDTDKVWPQLKDHTIMMYGTDTPPDEYPWNQPYVYKPTCLSDYVSSCGPTSNSQIFPHPVPIHPKQAEEEFVEKEVVCCGIPYKVRKSKK